MSVGRFISPGSPLKGPSRRKRFVPGNGAYGEGRMTRPKMLINRSAETDCLVLSETEQKGGLEEGGLLGGNLRDVLPVLPFFT